jgi:beta-phosphoglucomutase-like phosphatase (HAD superfamily)
MTKNWMRQLASHYETARRLHPEEDLLILFDIDGTIVDMRQMILAVLQEYDRENRTTWFQHLRAPQISVQEAQLRQLLESRRLPEAETEKVLAWYEKHRWSARALLQAHRPYHGVLEVIRWFQMQPRTFVGINSGRSEALRDETLRILNTLGREYRVHFSSELLHLNPHPQGQEVAESKANGLRRFNDSG